MFLINKENLNPPYHSYGWFHLMWLGVFFILAFIFVFFLARKHNKKIDSIVTIAIGSLLLALEIAKQIYVVKGKGFYPDSLIPLQLCSLPMFLWIPAVFLPESKPKDACYSFLSSYTFISGLLILIYPETCIGGSDLLLNIHSMIWHIGITILGLYLSVSREFGKNFKKDVIYPGILFIFLIILVVTLNETLNARGHSLDLFYLDFKHGCLLNIDSKFIYVAGETRLDWIIYIIGYMIGLFGLTCVQYLIFRLICKLKTKN